jgi:hypothetical protein
MTSVSRFFEILCVFPTAREKPGPDPPWFMELESAVWRRHALARLISISSKHPELGARITMAGVIILDGTDAGIGDLVKQTQSIRSTLAKSQRNVPLYLFTEQPTRRPLWPAAPGCSIAEFTLCRGFAAPSHQPGISRNRVGIIGS